MFVCFFVFCSLFFLFGLIDFGVLTWFGLARTWKCAQIVALNSSLEYIELKIWIYE
jgi:hypothetical protein